MLTPNDLILPFGGSYVFANFGENRSRNATVRVLADGQTDTQTQTDFIICPMLYAIAMGQIRRISQVSIDHRESIFLFQRLSVLILRFNAVAVLGTFVYTPTEDEI